MSDTNCVELSVDLRRALTRIADAHEKLASAESRRALAEERKARAMESLANELGNISSGFTGLENAIRGADFGVDTDEIEGGLEKIAKTIYEWSAE